MKRTALLSLLLLLAATVPTTTFQDQSQPTFRGGLDLVSVDVVVRDSKGEIVSGLTADDFEVREDGQPQQIRAFSFQQITDKAQAMGQVELLGDVQDRVDAATTAPPPTAAKPPVAAPTPTPPASAETPEASGPMRSQELAGRRLIVLLFDTSSMQPDDVQRSVDSALKYVNDQMSTSDLVAVATVNTSLNVLTDFTGDRTKVQAALTTLSYTDGTATPPPDDSTMVTDETTTTEDTTTDQTSEMDLFNNDVRLRVLKALAESLAPIEQKKAIVYFSAGMQRNGSDNQVELRSAINAAVRGNVSIYSVDTRGLQAVVPGGDATRASGRGQSLFSGRGMAQQFARLSASQDTLVSLSSDTGGRAFTDSNDFGAAFDRVRHDMSAYYILGYSSSNRTKDGRFRRIQVQLKRKSGYRVEARVGYYADRDFAHTAKADRESQLQDQLYSAVSSTDLPVIASAGWFRLAADKYYVPITLDVPGNAITIPAGKDKAVLDILGEVRDERGFPVGRIRQTMELPSMGADTLAGKQVLYQSGVTLPPGQFSFKVVVRENGDGLIGSFEAPVTIPELDKAPLKLSSVVLSTQLQAADKKKTDSPLVRDGVQLLPNLTHVVARGQKVYFYYEVYEPAAATTDLRTSLAFYRGKVKVLETPVVAKSAVDVPDRKAVLFQFEVPGDKFDPGLYTCQVNVIDEAGGNFAFPRLQMYVR